MHQLQSPHEQHKCLKFTILILYITNDGEIVGLLGLILAAQERILISIYGAVSTHNEIALVFYQPILETAAYRRYVS